MTSIIHPPAPPHPPGFAARIARLVRHRWAEGGLQRALPPDLLDRLARRVAASEARHTGQIRICAEGGLPASYLWRGASARERAVTLFGKLRVWDTEHNNGVLIYLLLADHRIEILADRGLNGHAPPGTWQAMADRLSGALREGRFEDGLNQAIDEVGALMRQHYPVTDSHHPDVNELSDAVVLM